MFQLFNYNLGIQIFSTRLRKPVDGSWGSLKEDGTFNGIIGMLERQVVDAGIAMFSMSKSRSSAAQHLIPIYNSA